MTAYTGTVGVEAIPNSGIKKVFIYTQDDAVATNTYTVDLTSLGITSGGLLAFQGWTQTTNGSVIVESADTTAVSSGVLTVTFAGTGVAVMEIVGLVNPDYTA